MVGLYHSIILAQTPFTHMDYFRGVDRVSIIQEKIRNQWRHVSTSDNPADLATRGVTPLELKESELWWQGPKWLQKERRIWPTTVPIPDTLIEAKPFKVHIARSEGLEDILERFSCLSRAIHVVAYMFRFFNHTRQTLRKTCNAASLRLSAEELSFCRHRLMSISQRLNFPIEYSCLEQKLKLPSSSPLLSLTPFLDKENIIRANGRLASSLSLSYNERHPIILAYQSICSTLCFVHP